MNIEMKGFLISLTVLAGVVGFLVWNRKQADKIGKPAYGTGK